MDSFLLAFRLPFGQCNGMKAKGGDFSSNFQGVNKFYLEDFYRGAVVKINGEKNLISFYELYEYFSNK